MKILSLLACLILFTFYCGGKDKTGNNASPDFDKICLDGHVYYEKTSIYKGYLAIKLSKWGNPVKCKSAKNNRRKK